MERKVPWKDLIAAGVPTGAEGDQFVAVETFDIVIWALSMAGLTGWCYGWRLNIIILKVAGGIILCSAV